MLVHVLPASLPAFSRLIAAILVLAFPIAGYAEEIIFFTDVDPTNPPSQVTSSSNINAQLLPLYEPYLHEFSVRTRFINTARAQVMLGQQANACKGKNVYTEERARHAIYSDLPQVIFPPLRLYMRAENIHADDVRALLEASEEGYLSIDDVLAVSPTLTLGRVQGRSYTPELDAVLDGVIGSSQVWVRSVQDQAAGLFDMLVNERIDLTIHTSVAMQRFIQSNNDTTDLLVIPLAEAQEALPGYIMCSSSSLGERFINAMNVALKEVSQTRQYFDYHMSWVPSAERPYLAALYNQTYGTNFSL